MPFDSPLERLIEQLGKAREASMTRPEFEEGVETAYTAMREAFEAQGMKYGVNEPVEVPAGSYFVMGDSRDNSQDSRFTQASGGVGFVPKENLIGRADRVIFSSAGRSMLYFWTWRPDRFFLKVD